MLGFSWCSALLCALFFVHQGAASVGAGPAQALWLYYVYAAEVVVYGADKTHFLPSEIVRGSPQLTLSTFIELGLLTRGQNPTAQRQFQNGYAADIKNAKPILGTTTPNFEDAEEYLKNCGYFSGVFDLEALFGERDPPINSLPGIAELATNWFQRVRQVVSAKDAATVEALRQKVIQSLQLSYQWRLVENKNAVGVLKEAVNTYPALRGAPLKVVSVTSSVDASVQVLDLDETFLQSPDLTAAQKQAVTDFFTDALKAKNGTPLRKVGNHSRGVAAINTHLGRVINDDPTC